MKLKLELFRYDTLVFGRVLEQAEELRLSREIANNVIAATKGFEIRSDYRPNLIWGCLYIRGENPNYDNEVFSFCFSSEEKAKNACNVIVELVDKINSDTDADLGGIVRIL